MEIIEITDVLKYKEELHKEFTFNKVDNYSLEIVIGNKVVNFLLNDTLFNAVVYDNIDECLDFLSKQNNKINGI